MRVIIVDDEPLARAVLREHLAAHPDAEVVAECANGFEAVKAIGELAPDLVFLDIQMPRLDGFEVVELAGTGTLYVFVTAYDQFALRAFEVHAIDYLLKPFAGARLDAALAHARTRLRATAKGGEGPESEVRNKEARDKEARTGEAQGADALRAVVRDAAQRRVPVQRVLVREGTRVHVVPAETIDYVEAQDDYVSICAGGKRWLKSQRLSELEGQLDPQAFVRVHRSYLVNAGAIARIEPLGKDSHCAVLRDGTRIPVSRSGYARVRERMR